MGLVSHKTEQQLLLRFMLKYIIVMLLPFTLVSIIYFNVLKMIERDTIYANIRILEKNKDILENRIREIDSIIEQVCWNPKIIRYNSVTMPFSGPNVYKILETRDQLYDYSLTNSLVNDYYVIYLNSNILMGVNQTYRLDQFYNFFFRYRGIDFNEWYAEISKPYTKGTILPEREVIFKKKTYNVLPYIRDLTRSPSGSSSKVMMLLDGDELRKLMHGYNFSETGWAYIADESGRLLISFPPGLKENKFISPISVEEENPKGYEILDMDGEKIIYTYIVSQNNGWKYVVAQPYDSVMKKVSFIKNINYVIMSVALTIGLLTAYFWANRNSYRLKGVFELFNEHFGRNMAYKDPFEHIHSAVQKIIQNNEVLNSTIQQQVSFLRSSFFQKLISGDFESEKELETYARYVGIDFNGKSYAVCIVQMLGYGHGLIRVNDEIFKELDVRRLKVKDALQSNSFAKTHLYDIRYDRIMLLFVLDDKNYSKYRKQISDYLSKIKGLLMSNYGIDIRFALAELCHKPLEITNCIHKELQVLDYAQMDEEYSQAELWCNEVFDTKYGCFYPKEWEYRLINFTKDGNTDKTIEILKKLKIENIIKRKLTPGMLKLFLYQLYGTLLRVMQETSIESKEITDFEEKFKNHNDSYTLCDDVYRFIIDSFEYICSVINERKKDQNARLMNEVKAYIEENYNDKELSLVALSDRFNYSPAYLSLFFKEQTGKNFSTYLEEIRMHKAEKLLLDTNMAISEIAGKVGYNSHNSFCRAFKRIYGIPPGQYKKVNMGRNSKSKPPTKSMI